MNNLMIDYYKWLTENTISTTLSKDCTEITTPFLDRHNDGIVIYMEKKSNGTYLLTDDGYTLNDLESDGLKFTEIRKELLHNTLRRYGVKEVDSELTVIANEKDLILKTHLLIQSILSIGDMFLLNKSTTKNLFIEDVTEYLDKINARYIKDVELVGESGLQHCIDFMIGKNPKTKTKERIIQTMNTPSKSNIERALFQWNDIRSNRDTEFYLMINDKKEIDSMFSKAVENYKGNLILWSEKDKYSDLFVA